MQMPGYGGSGDVPGDVPGTLYVIHGSSGIRLVILFDFDSIVDICGGYPRAAYKAYDKSSKIVS